MQAAGLRNPYRLSFQSEVGPVRWLGPSTETMIRQLAARGQKHVLVVPIAFTSDHIETLSEIDIEYSELEYALGMTGSRRVPSFNARTEFLDALADTVHGHLESGKPHSAQYRQRCPGCTNDSCRGPPSKMSAPLQLQLLELLRSTFRPSPPAQPKTLPAVRPAVAAPPRPYRHTDRAPPDTRGARRAGSGP